VHLIDLDLEILTLETFLKEKREREKQTLGPYFFFFMALGYTLD